MEKKVATLFLLVFLIGLFLPFVSLAGEYKLSDGTPVCYQGLVPCGKEVMLGGTWQNGKCVGGTPTLVYCQFCHFFVMINGIFNFVLKDIVPPLAVVMLAVGGIMFYFAGGSPGLVEQGKKLILWAVIGIFIIYGSFAIVGFLLKVVGAANTNPISSVWQNGAFTINCPIELSGAGGGGAGGGGTGGGGAGGGGAGGGGTGGGGAAQLPDLEAEDIWIVPAEFNPGNIVEIHTKIKNIGSGDVVGTFKTKLYFDNNPVDSYDKDGLTAGETYTPYLLSYTWPSDTNFHTLKIVTDTEGSISESNESNNDLTKSFAASPVAVPSWHYCLSSSEIPPDDQDDQIADASNALKALLTCADNSVPAKDPTTGSCQWTITSISDSAGMANCQGDNWSQPPCAHAHYSCHYGGHNCQGKSYAIDLALGYPAALINAMKTCYSGTIRVNHESNHDHISIGCSEGCGCDCSLPGL